MNEQKKKVVVNKREFNSFAKYIRFNGIYHLFVGIENSIWWDNHPFALMGDMY